MWGSEALKTVPVESDWISSFSPNSFSLSLCRDSYANVRTGVIHSFEALGAIPLP